MATIRHRMPRRMRAYRWAARQKGHPYVYGGTGPGFDCSGLVMEAYMHAGIRLPRTTYGMLASRKLVRVIHPRMGDLAFYGTGHVELFRRWGYTFGAHDSGTRVGLFTTATAGGPPPTTGCASRLAARGYRRPLDLQARVTGRFRSQVRGQQPEYELRAAAEHQVGRRRRAQPGPDSAAG